jgi:hypothetical protein
MTTSRRTGEKAVPVLYLDLDGTVRKGKDELGRFVNGPDDVELFPEVPDYWPPTRIWAGGSSAAPTRGASPWVT